MKLVLKFLILITIRLSDTFFAITIYPYVDIRQYRLSKTEIYRDAVIGITSFDIWNKSDRNLRT